MKVVRFSFVTSFLPLLRLLRTVQLTTPIGDDGQLMSSGSSGRPVLWLSTDAVQLAVPTGDDGQLMSGGSSAWPLLWLSTHAVQFFLRLRRALFRSYFAFLFVALQTFRFLRHSSLSLCNLFRSYVVPLYRSSDFSVPTSFLFIALQTSPFLCRSSLSFFFQGVIFQTVGFSEA